MLKSADKHLRFVFITGVTKFCKVSIFSDLNQLRDISLERAYADVCGITEMELLEVLAPEVDALAAQLGVSRDECVQRLRNQYDGYCFHSDGPGGKDGSARRVYNPHSLISALQKRSLGSYWFETSTPTFLVCRMQDAGLEPKRLTDGSIYVTEDRLSDYRTDDPDPVPLLFQAGYLTIREYDAIAGEYGLAVPNGEVEWGLFKSLLPAWAPGYGGGNHVSGTAEKRLQLAQRGTRRSL